MKEDTSELIPTGMSVVSGAEIPTVNARELHEFLGVNSKYQDWLKRRVDEYLFKENEDFVVFLKNEKNLPSGGRPTSEYHISLDMAKELAMVERNEKGREARKYFIECERRLKASPHFFPGVHAFPSAQAAGLRKGLAVARASAETGVPVKDVAQIIKFRKAGLTRQQAGSAFGVGLKRLARIDDILKASGISFDPISPGDAGINAVADLDRILMADIQPALNAGDVYAIMPETEDVALFVREHCLLGEGRVVQTTHLYEQFKVWCRLKKRPMLGRTWFYRFIIRMVPKAKKCVYGGKRLVHFTGIGLRYIPVDTGAVKGGDAL